MEVVESGDQDSPALVAKTEEVIRGNSFKVTIFTYTLINHFAFIYIM